MRQSPEQTRFNSGEYGGSMKARRDTSEYGGACQNMENWVPTAQGGMIRRSGSWYGGLSLDPPPEPPLPPGDEPIQSPISYTSDGEWHGYSVRRRLNNDYEGPLMLVGRDPSVSGNDVLVDIGTTPDPDSNGIYWIDESRVLQAFIATGQDPSVTTARLSVYTIFDQITNAAVTPRDMTVPNTNFAPCPFAFSGEFGSFAYVNVSADITAPKYARCQMGCGIPWRGFQRRNLRSGMNYDAASPWSPTLGNLGNGGVVSVAALDNFVSRGTGNTRRLTQGIARSNNTFLLHHEQTGSSGPGVTSLTEGANVPFGNVFSPGVGEPSTSFSTPDQFNITCSAYKFDVAQGNTAFGYSVIGSRDDRITVTGNTNAEVGGSEPSASFQFGNVNSDSDGNSFSEYNYFNFTDWWFLLADTGQWGGNSCVDDADRCEELAKTVKLDPKNAIPIP